MAPPAAGVQGGQAPQWRQQQQQQRGFGFAGIIRMAVFWYFASKFFSPRKPTEPSALISNLFQKGQPILRSDAILLRVETLRGLYPLLLAEFVQRLRKFSIKTFILRRRSSLLENP